MLLCAPRFSAAFVGLKGPAASRGAHSRDTSFSRTAVSARPEARSPQSHCSLQPVFHRQLGSMAQTAEPEQPSVPAPKGPLPPSPPLAKVKKCVQTLYLYLGAIGLGLKSY